LLAKDIGGRTRWHSPSCTATLRRSGIRALLRPPQQQQQQQQQQPFTAAATRGDPTKPLGDYKLLNVSMEHELNWA
jgi:hypothetical protein